MTVKTPLLDSRDADRVVTGIEEALAAQSGWRGQAGGPGRALVRLFGRLAELVINRLNQAPDKHFLAFLNEAGLTRLPAKPANTELTFTLAENGPPFIRIPAGTQVATIQTETQPELIFETQRDLVVTPNRLSHCFTFDPLTYSDRTRQATGQVAAAFPAFKGDQERERLLLLGDDQLFLFPDPISRQAATITLIFEFDRPGNAPADGWQVEWLYWNGAAWSSLTSAGAVVTDNTGNFSQDGAVQLSNLPELTETEVGGQRSRWLGCQLTDGTARNHLPRLKRVKANRSIEFAETTMTLATAFSAVQAGTAFVPLDPTAEFFPLGQLPRRLDTFYLPLEAARLAAGVTVTLHVDLIGLPEVPADTNLSELNALTINWEYFSAAGWIRLGASTRTEVTPAGFTDETKAFTESGNADEDSSKKIEFTIPNDPPFSETIVNDQEGCWLRARIIEGSYDVPGVLPPQDTEQVWRLPVTYPPLITDLKITYSGFTSELGNGPEPVDYCRSRVDGTERSHTGELSAGQPWTPFCAGEEGPALYLGFQQAYPEDQWIRLLLDVEERTTTVSAGPELFWEYWNGRWTLLRVSDGSQGLTQRGYLGFYGPADHQPHSEFGQIAYWLRARPARSHPRPVAHGGDDQFIKVTAGQVELELDASGSQVFACQSISRYRWRLVSSSPLIAEAGPDQTVRIADAEATVSLDASSSYSSESIRHYRWRLVSSSPPIAEAGPDQTVLTAGAAATAPLDASGSRSFFGADLAKYIWQTVPEQPPPVPTPYLKVIRLNTVSALDAVTINEEVLGSSDGKPDQQFTVLRPPLLPKAQIAVREPDRPPNEELRQLQQELRLVDEAAQGVWPGPESTPGTGVWVRWQQVSDFHSSTPASRHVILDPISGQIRFGDGKRGKIPPIGRDNIKLVRYQTHHGSQGNVKANSVTVVRNPSGDLAHIKRATNPEAASGGSEAETVTEVKQRGPQTLKHRQRAVTVEDFVWLTREASGEVAQARCLPARNRKGLSQAGWVTVVITPESAALKPTPSPTLLRNVEAHLKNHALATLEVGDQIFVKGPEYIEATVLASVAPTEPEKADEVELMILERLENFLHPLRGGPDRSGWELGRDVYLSEICAEIEAVSGVDHVVRVQLNSSLQQHRLRLKPGPTGYARIPFDLPVGSQVSTFDERIKLRLAEPVHALSDNDHQNETEDKELTELAVYGFKRGDQVAVVAADNTVLTENLEIAAIALDSITFALPFDRPSTWPEQAELALMSPDGRLRLPVPAGRILVDEAQQVRGVTVENFKINDRVSVVVGTHRNPALELLAIESVEECRNRLFVPEGHLVYSGSHDIDLVLE